MEHVEHARSAIGGGGGSVIDVNYKPTSAYGYKYSHLDGAFLKLNNLNGMIKGLNRGRITSL